MNAIPAVSAFVDTLEGDAKTGAKIVLKLLKSRSVRLPQMQVLRAA